MSIIVSKKRAFVFSVVSATTLLSSSVLAQANVKQEARDQKRAELVDQRNAQRQNMSDAIGDQVESLGLMGAGLGVYAGSNSVSRKAKDGKTKPITGTNLSLTDTLIGDLDKTIKKGDKVTIQTEYQIPGEDEPTAHTTKVVKGKHLAGSKPGEVEAIVKEVTKNLSTEDRKALADLAQKQAENVRSLSADKRTIEQHKNDNVVDTLKKLAKKGHHLTAFEVEAKNAKLLRSLGRFGYLGSFGLLGYSGYRLDQANHAEKDAEANVKDLDKQIHDLDTDLVPLDVEQ